MSSITYRPEIDGLRAVAVLPVILFHLGVSWIPGGFIGVDVFFVISGFLITSIILKDYEQGVFRFGKFWLRRIRRILPVLIVIVFVTLIAGKYLLYAPDIFNLGNQGIATLLSFANISQWLTAGDYWGYTAENSPLLHTWSLSVEEQFYLFFPFLIILGLKYLSKWLALIVLVICLCSVLLFIYGTKHHPDATFYLLPTRIWELGSGALLAILTFKKNLTLQNNQLISIVGFVSVILSYFLINGDSGISPYIVIPVIGSVLIILSSNGKNSIIRRALSVKPIVYIGKISYSLYLWHWPVFVFSRNITLKTGTEYPLYLLLGFVFLLSILSYHYIEIPTRRNAKLVPYILSILFAGVAYSYSLSTSTYSEDTTFYNKTRWDGEFYNVIPAQEWPDSIKKKMEGITVTRNPNKASNVYSGSGVTRLYGKKTPEIVVLGDSHGLMWSSVFDEIAKELGKSISFYVADGTPVFFDIPVKKSHKTIYFNADEKFVYDKSRLAHLKKWKPEIVIIAKSWSGIDDIETTQDLIKLLGEIGSNVLILEQPPELFFGDKSAPQFLSYYGLKPSKDTQQYVSYLNTPDYQDGREAIRKIAKSCHYCEFIPIADLYIKDRKALVLDSFDVLYIDDDHLSYAGSLKSKGRILKAIKPQRRSAGRNDS